MDDIEARLVLTYVSHGEPTTYGPTTDVIGLNATPDKEKYYKFLGYTYIGSGIWTKHTKCSGNWMEYFGKAYKILEYAGKI